MVLEGDDVGQILHAVGQILHPIAGLRGLPQSRGRRPAGAVVSEWRSIRVRRDYRLKRQVSAEGRGLGAAPEKKPV